MGFFKKQKNTEKKLRKEEEDAIVKDKEACENEITPILQKYNLRLAVRVQRFPLGPVTERADIIFVRPPKENTITQIPVNSSAPGQMGAVPPRP